MHRFNITIKIWLSIGAFALGYVFAVALGQIQGVAMEATLRTTSEGLFPAAQKSQEADSAFQRMAKGFGDAVMTQDASGSIPPQRTGGKWWKGSRPRLRSTVFRPAARRKRGRWLKTPRNWWPIRAVFTAAFSPIPPT